MPVLDNEVSYYDTLSGYVYIDAVTGDTTMYATSFAPDWKVDEDPRKVAGYIECLSERYADRNNDEYAPDLDVRYSTGKGDAVTFGSSYRSTADEAKSYTPHPGYDLLSDGVVRCWYCDGVADYRWFRSGWESHTDAMERFVTEMLTHYSAHRSEGDLPYVRTYLKVGVRRPDGSVTTIPEHARRVTKPWQVKGALL